MDIEQRTWLVRTADGVEQGPFSEDEFQDRLRAGDIPLFYQIKSNQMNDWKPILDVITSDESFHRTSTMPPPLPRDDTE